jgi:hypothetical protein
MHICKVEIPFNQGEVEKTMLVDGSNLGPAVASIVDSEVGVDLAVVHVRFGGRSRSASGRGRSAPAPVPKLKIKIKLAEPAKQCGNAIVNVCSDSINLTVVFINIFISMQNCSHNIKGTDKIKRYRSRIGVKPTRSRACSVAQVPELAPGAFDPCWLLNPLIPI